jgi:hypothetical protein
MMDVISYYDLTGISPNFPELAAAIVAIENEMGKKPFELRAGPVIARRFLSIIQTYGVSIARVEDDGRVVVLGIPLKVLPDSYDPNTVLAIMSSETHFAGGQDDPE